MKALDKGYRLKQLVQKVVGSQFTILPNPFLSMLKHSIIESKSHLQFFSLNLYQWYHYSLVLNLNRTTEVLTIQV
jgi:hypothetical protein